MDCNVDAYSVPPTPNRFCPARLRDSQVSCNWKDPLRPLITTFCLFCLITDKPSCFSLINSESKTSADIWKVWEDAVEWQISELKINGPKWAQGEKKWSETCNLISGKAIWIQDLPICQEWALNSENIKRFNEDILEKYKIEQVYVNPKSPLGCLMIEEEGLLYSATGEEPKKPKLDFESQQFIATLGKLNDIVVKTIPKEKVSEQKKCTVYTSKKSLWGRVSSSSAGRLFTAVANKILHPARNVKVLASAVLIISLGAILFRYSPRKMTNFG